MGGLLSLFANTGRTDDPDAITGLTSRDRHLIRTSWHALRVNPVQSGVKLLITYFDKCPNDQKYFFFKDLTLEQLAEDKHFQAHCSAIIYAFNNVVDHLDDADLLSSIAIKIGRSHKLRNIPEQPFENLKKVILELFATLKFSKETLNSWDKALKVLFTVIEQEL